MLEDGVSRYLTERSVVKICSNGASGTSGPADLFFPCQRRLASVKSQCVAACVRHQRSIACWACTSGAGQAWPVS